MPKNEAHTPNKLHKLLVVGDRLLVKPKASDEKTSGGLYLPPGVQESEKIQSGYVMIAGPGYPVPSTELSGESWKGEEEKVKYMPLQARPGDLAIFLQNSAYEIMYEGERYFVVPHNAVLLLERDPELLG
jgi:chaperonin GroES